MKNPASYIREKLIALLNETITYDGQLVPCYEGEGEVAPYQILLTSQTKTNRHNRDSFTWKAEQRIEFISEQATSVHKHVDAMADQALQILKPTPRTSAFIGNEDFQVLGVDVEIGNYIDEPSGQGTIINRLPLILTFQVSQKQFV